MWIGLYRSDQDNCTQEYEPIASVFRDWITAVKRRKIGRLLKLMNGVNSLLVTHVDIKRLAIWTNRVNLLIIL
jgi:hypothetical protein